MTVHEAVEKQFARWAYLRVVPNSGGVRVSPIHTHPKCWCMNRVDSGEQAEIVRVLLSALDGHAILGELRICRHCEAAGASWDARNERQIAEHKAAAGAHV